MCGLSCVGQVSLLCFIMVLWSYYAQTMSDSDIKEYDIDTRKIHLLAYYVIIRFTSNIRHKEKSNFSISDQKPPICKRLIFRSQKSNNYTIKTR